MTAYHVVISALETEPLSSVETLRVKGASQVCNRRRLVTFNTIFWLLCYLLWGDLLTLSDFIHAYYILRLSYLVIQCPHDRNVAVLLLLLLRACQLKLRKHLSQRLIVQPKTLVQHRFSNPLSLIKRQRSLTEVVLMSSSSTDGYPKTL